MIEGTCRAEHESGRRSVIVTQNGTTLYRPLSHCHANAMKPHTTALLYFIIGVYGQSCKNSGIQNGSSCACPVGFGGSDCSEPACGGDLFSSNRPLTTSQSNGFPNITASSCSCETDWSGLGCNVCTSSAACQTAFSASGHSSSDSTSGLDTGINSTLVCNRATQVHASGQMSCNVIVRVQLVG